MFPFPATFFSFLSFLSFLLSDLLQVWAETNVTVDNSDSSILYHPSASWSLDDSYSSGATDHFTSDVEAWATLNFTGTAVYYLVHYYPSDLPAGGMISLDGGPAVAVTMWDPTRDQYARQWETVWSATNLTNTAHMVNVSWWPNQVNQYISLDTIMYTVDNDTESTSTGSPAPVASAAQSESSSSSSNHTAGIVVGVVLGLLFLVAAAAAVFFFLRTRREKASPTQNPPPPNAVPRSDVGSTYMAEPFPSTVGHVYAPAPTSPGRFASPSPRAPSMYSAPGTGRDSLYGSAVGRESVYNAPFPDNTSSAGPQGSNLSRVYPQV